ncbi:hypothetical protein DAPPUDRAFT_337320 [Daphnia pulex]|uniref:Uncharacterized protein n=1 Tax=Daphnia pulex TaxID=6669 RepID=E9I1F0_DAPPU|nr:hypothetical protein DAPPUDRAFT_337320 [Daphnia pulex]|eukprot:EFX62177.1 hypothetical protein DAPPUDRAFT_337320 [Daphnia pulex]
MNEDIIESKEYKKAKKLMSEESVKEYLTKSDEDLKEVISRNTVYVKSESEKLKSHVEYVKASETKKLLDSGIKDALAPYKAAADFAARILKERG